jgi:hypothetical protein
MAAAITYRKTQQGEWVAYGPAAAMRKGAVTVSKRDGSIKTEQVERLGKTFTVGGVPMCYGYLAKTAPVRSAGRGEGSCRHARYESRSCDDCQWVEDAGDANGCSRHRGNPRN